jgi:glutaredoxin-related protein
MDERVQNPSRRRGLEALSQKSRQMSCPIVYVGEELVGGAQDVIDAHHSGRLADLVGK